ncbi:hypothetical protein [Desertivirga arenae]|uniref:hypothetical protein n=1 Tax=Desertivirga arenae TaxID=2810309 RepID=UPI001A96FE64|nr:hypothetical protein [Pedobacter sp. SYSU D00823]
MKIYRRVSLIEICFVLLFVFNCQIVFQSIVKDGPVLTTLAILFSILQFYLLGYFGAKHRFLGTISSSRAAIAFFKDKSTARASEEVSPPLTIAEKALVRKRARNIQVKQDSLTPNANDFRTVLTAPITRVKVGTEQCSNPYFLSILNSTALGAFSSEEVYITSQGARLGKFGLFTGLTGLSAAHIRGGADLIWQFPLLISSVKDFESSDEMVFFRRNALRPYIKMVEINIRRDERWQYGMWVDEYNRISFEKQNRDWEKNVGDLAQILTILSRLRFLAEGKPVGLRLTLRKEEDVITISQAIQCTSIIPDFITIDQLSDYRILKNVKDYFENLRIPTTLIYSGPIVSELDLLRAISLGASACVSTVALIKAITASSFSFAKPITRSVQLANYHRNTISALYTHTHTHTHTHTLK